MQLFSICSDTHTHIIKEPQIIGRREYVFWIDRFIGQYQHYSEVAKLNGFQSGITGYSHFSWTESVTVSEEFQLEIDKTNKSMSMQIWFIIHPSLLLTVSLHNLELRKVGIKVRKC